MLVLPSSQLPGPETPNQDNWPIRKETIVWASWVIYVEGGARLCFP